MRFVAKAIAGYNVIWNSVSTNPETRFSSQFLPSSHYADYIHFLGDSDLIGAMGGNPAPILGQAWPRLGFV